MSVLSVYTFTVLGAMAVYHNVWNKAYDSLAQIQRLQLLLF